MLFILWLIAVILVIWGIVTLVRGQVLMGIVLIIATTVLVVNIVTDIAYTYADPRVRLARSG